jgi:hypothetical protein
MPTPNIPADFDFVDPDVNLAGLPVAELAELRTAEPVHWVDVLAGTGGSGTRATGSSPSTRTSTRSRYAATCSLVGKTAPSRSGRRR